MIVMNKKHYNLVVVNDEVKRVAQYRPPARPHKLIGPNLNTTIQFTNPATNRKMIIKEVHNNRVPSNGDPSGNVGVFYMFYDKAEDQWYHAWKGGDTVSTNTVIRLETSIKDGRTATKAYANGTLVTDDPWWFKVELSESFKNLLLQNALYYNDGFVHAFWMGWSEATDSRGKITKVSGVGIGYDEMIKQKFYTSANSTRYEYITEEDVNYHEPPAPAIPITKIKWNAGATEPTPSTATATDNKSEIRKEKIKQLQLRIEEEKKDLSTMFETTVEYINPRNPFMGSRTIPNPKYVEKQKLIEELEKELEQLELEQAKEDAIADIEAIGSTTTGVKPASPIDDPAIQEVRKNFDIESLWYHINEISEMLNDGIRWDILRDDRERASEGVKAEMDAKLYKAIAKFDYKYDLYKLTHPFMIGENPYQEEEDLRQRKREIVELLEANANWLIPLAENPDTGCSLNNPFWSVGREELLNHEFEKAVEKYTEANISNVEDLDLIDEWVEESKKEMEE